MKKILYLSPLSSKRLVNYIHLKSGNNFIFAGQKFNRLIAKGLMCNGAIVEIYSKPPVNDVVGRKWVSISDETEDGLTYKYINHFNIPIIRDIMVFVKSFFKVFVFGLCNKRDKCVVCDILSVSLNVGAVLASKIVGIKIVGIVTDMPGLMVNTTDKKKLGLINIIHSKLEKKYINYYSHYIFLTDSMNNVINIYKKPYIVMEALCDNLVNNRLMQQVKAEPKIVLYAGGLHEKYGLKKLVEAFHMLSRQDVKLVIYGSGPYAEELKQVLKCDSRIEYRGVAKNEDVIKAELEATLLVNPRPTTEEFAKYSFPSKNMEYMTSGTPLITTKLPGIPQDYYPYVYFFEEESVDGYADALDKVLNISIDELQIKGQSAKNYVSVNKNYIVQTKRILDLIN